MSTGDTASVISADERCFSCGTPAGRRVVVGRWCCLVCGLWQSDPNERESVHLIAALAAAEARIGAMEAVVEAVRLALREHPEWAIHSDSRGWLSGRLTLYDAALAADPPAETP